MKLQVGIIGAGKIVESSHLPVLLSIPEVNVSWIFDKDERRAELINKMYFVRSIPESRLDKNIEEIDICLIALPYGVRGEYIRRCADLNKSVYIEKPFATSVAEHIMYSSMFPIANIAVGFQRRYYPFVTMLEKLIKDQTFGSIKRITFNQGYFQLKGGTTFSSNAKLSGGGVIIESAIHTLDQVLQFCDAEQVDVKELQSIAKNGIDYDTRFISQISNGKETFEVHAHISCLRNLDNGISIEFENRTLSFLPSANVIFYEGKSRARLQQEGSSTVNIAFLEFWKEFLNAIRFQQANLTSACSSLLTTEWVEKIYKKINAAA